MKTRITIIGAGVVGLAIAAKLSDSFDEIILLEKAETFGTGASSRNSEVIHASIYYPKESLKGKLCLRGNALLYELCEKYSIPYSNCGKFIVATNDDEVKELETVLATAQGNGARGVRIMEAREIKNIEPRVYAKAAVYSPSSGIVDSHGLMAFFERKALENGVSIVYNHEVTDISKSNGEYVLTVKDAAGNEFILQSDSVINA